MCGRFAFYSPHEAVVRLFGLPDAPEVEPRWNIAPTQFVATVRESGGPRELAMLESVIEDHRRARERGLRAPPVESA